MKPIAKGSGEPFVTQLEENSEYICLTKEMKLTESEYKGEKNWRIQCSFVTVDTKDTEVPQHINLFKISPRIPAVGNEWNKYRGSAQDRLFNAYQIKDKLQTEFGGFELETQDDVNKLFERIKNIPIKLATGAHTKTENGSVYPNVAAVLVYKEAVQGGKKKASF